MSNGLSLDGALLNGCLVFLAVTICLLVAGVLLTIFQGIGSPSFRFIVWFVFHFCCWSAWTCILIHVTAKAIESMDKNLVGRQRWVPVIVIIILIAYVLPFAILGKDAPILIHDTLDCWVVWVKVLDNWMLGGLP